MLCSASLLTRITAQVEERKASLNHSLRLYSKKIEANPEDFLSRASRARVLEKLGREDEAEREYREVLEVRGFAT